MTAEQSAIERGLQELVPFWGNLDLNQRAFLAQRSRLMQFDAGDHAILLDTRTAGERSRGGVEDALHIPVDELREQLDELPRDKRLLVFCASGLRSYVACRILSQHGFACANVSGGYGFHSQVKRGCAVSHTCVGDCGLPA